MLRLAFKVIAVVLISTLVGVSIGHAASKRIKRYMQTDPVVVCSWSGDFDGWIVGRSIEIDWGVYCDGPWDGYGCGTYILTLQVDKIVNGQWKMVSLNCDPYSYMSCGGANSGTMTANLGTGTYRVFATARPGSCGNPRQVFLWGQWGLTL